MIKYYYWIKEWRPKGMRLEDDKRMEREFCTGNCQACGRCTGTMNDAMGGTDGSETAEGRKTGMLQLPTDFTWDTGEKGLGLAFDLGTTTVVGFLWDFERGRLLGSRARRNPQGEHGADVITRISFCGQESGNLALLREAVLACMNEMGEELCQENGADSERVVRAVVAGNTTMSHIFAGYSPASLAAAPFAPAFKGPLWFSGRDSGLRMAPTGEVLLLPGIAGHVGGDITAGLLATRFTHRPGLTLLIDAGTNGEIVLGKEGRIVACSTAAGPAFEGASIECGMRAAAGAIESVVLRGRQLEWKTIGGGEPVGICGSGLIDIVAALRQAGFIDQSGRLAAGSREFLLYQASEGRDIVLTQRDIREVQLAKSAVAAGILTLLEELGEGAEDIEQLLVAGAFGNFIRPESALEIGLFPPVAPERIQSVGNAAGAGALMALASGSEAQRAIELPACIEHIELAANKRFREEYIEQMLF